MAKNLEKSPAGILKWGHIDKPNTKFDVDGCYTADIVIEGENADTFKAVIDAKAKEARAEFAKKDPKVAKYEIYVPYGANEDKDGNDLGGTLFKFKNKAVGVNKKKNPPEKFNVSVDVFDCKGQQLKGVKIGRGSELRIAFAFYPCLVVSTKRVGVGMRLHQVLVKTLVEYNGSGTSVFGSEEGYTAPSDTGSNEFTDGVEQPAEDGTGDF